MPKDSDQTVGTKRQKCLGCMIPGEPHTHPSPRRIEEGREDRSPSVLLIEDEPITQFVHKRMLQSLGARVEMAKSAKEALDMLRNNYDLILLDVGLPDIRGIELAMTIHTQIESLPSTRLVILTAHLEKSIIDECLAIGVESVIHKPIDIEKLRELLYPLGTES